MQPWAANRATFLLLTEAQPRIQVAVGQMIDETAVERLKRLQRDLLKVCAETTEIRAQAKQQLKTRQKNESTHIRALSPSKRR